MNAALVLALWAQLVAPNAKLPQVMTPKFSAAAPIKAGQKANIAVAFSVIANYKINRDPVITLALTPISGIKLASTTIESSPIDKKSKDEYYVDLPTLQIGLTVAKSGKYELPGKLTYFFCSKTDGFCSKQSVDLKIPVQAE
jgi:hypothetical protein